MATYSDKKKNTVRLDLLHFNRYKKERRLILSAIEDAQTFSEDTATGQKAWEDIKGFFAGHNFDREALEVYGREGDYLEALKFWKQAGSSIFTFEPDLLEMFMNTEVEEVPINSLHLPYPSVYIYFGESDPLPTFHAEYRVDGVYLWGDPKDVAFWKEEPPPDVDRVCRNAETGLKTLIDAIDHSEKYDEKYVKWCKEVIQERGGTENYVQNIVASHVEEWETQNLRYQAFMADPDSFVYGQDGRWENYLSLAATFTVTRKSGDTRAQNADELVSEPFLKARYEFETHRISVREAIESLYKDGVCAMEHHIGDRDIDPHGNLVITPGNSSYRDEREHFPDGTGRGALHRLNSHLNVTNRPDLLPDMTKLVFNALCYLNWKDRDVVLKYPDERLVAEEAKAKRPKERKKVADKAQARGYRKINFCGYTYPLKRTNEQLTARDGKIKSHWRRGHWRNQLFGKGLRDAKLIWIQPVLVGPKSADAAEPSIYNV